MAEIKSESVADFIPESVADLLRNQQFTAKPPVSRPSAADTPPTDQAARKPRVLGIVPTAPVRVEEVNAPVRLEQRTPRAIPRSQFARIRALVKYGMTVGQVAEVYGVAVGDVERILRNA